jgi:hypothetical protein
MAKNIVDHMIVGHCNRQTEAIKQVDVLFVRATVSIRPATSIGYFSR